MKCAYKWFPRKAKSFTCLIFEKLCSKHILPTHKQRTTKLQDFSYHRWNIEEELLTREFSIKQGHFNALCWTFFYFLAFCCVCFAFKYLIFKLCLGFSVLLCCVVFFSYITSLKSHTAALQSSG